MKKPHFEKSLPKTDTSPPRAEATRPGAALQDHLRTTGLGLNMWQKIRLGRHTSARTADALAEVTATLVAKQRDEITHRLMLELDIDKKRAFQDYMATVGLLNQELLERSNAMERDLRRVMRMEIEAIYGEYEEWRAGIDRQSLSDAHRDAELARIEEWIQFAKGQIEGKVNTLIESHSASFKITLELLRDTALGEH